MHTTLEHRAVRGPHKGAKYIATVLGSVIFFLLTACSSGSYLVRKSPDTLGIEQQLEGYLGKSEYVFCRQESGAWKCGPTSKKTLAHSAPTVPLVEAVVNTISKDYLDQNVKSLPSKTAVTNMNSDFSDVIGDSLGEILFDFDSSTLKSRAKSYLDEKIAPSIVNPIVLIGFTDDIGTEKYNTGLALERALSVKKYLITKGFPPHKVHASGQGACCYRNENGTEEQRQKNRRVEVYLAD